MPKHHLSNGTFRNNSKLINHHADLKSLVKWKLAFVRVKRQYQPVLSPRLPAIDKRSNYTVWIGHSTFLIVRQGITMLTDPQFSDRASPSQLAGPKRTTAPALSIDQLPLIDIVVVSHDHYDHLDKNSVIKLCSKQKNNLPLFVVPLKVGRWLTKLGVHKWVELDWWESSVVKNLSFTAVPVQHFSGRGLVRNNTLWAGWVIESQNANTQGVSHKIFFAGDTGYSDDFVEIGKRFGAMDLSLIPIGAYEPQWFMREMHVNPEEAVKIHLDVNSKFSIGMHWGSFILTDEPMDEPPRKLEEAKIKYGLMQHEFISVKHGEVVFFDNQARTL